MVVTCEQPNAKLYTFDGAVVDRKDGNVPQQPLTADNLLLRGCTLRKTTWVVSALAGRRLALISAGHGREAKPWQDSKGMSASTVPIIPTFPRLHKPITHSCPIHNLSTSHRLVWSCSRGLTPRS